MAGLKGMIETGAMIIIGIIALKAFGGVKGLTDLIGGIGDLFGTGNGGGGNGSTPTPTPQPLPPIPEDGSLDIIQPQPKDPINPWSLLFPPWLVTEYLDFIQTPPPTVHHYESNGNGNGNGGYTPSPTAPTPPSPDPITPDQPMVWIQPPSMVPDPFRPAVGGR